MRAILLVTKEDLGRTMSGSPAKPFAINSSYISVTLDPPTAVTMQTYTDFGTHKLAGFCKLQIQTLTDSNLCSFSWLKGSVGHHYLNL